jgi:tetrahydromethanopterin S-methyltransferase subunit E
MWSIKNVCYKLKMKNVHILVLLFILWSFTMGLLIGGDVHNGVERTDPG